MQSIADGVNGSNTLGPFQLAIKSYELMFYYFQKLDTMHAAS